MMIMLFRCLITLLIGLKFTVSILAQGQPHSLPKKFQYPTILGEGLNGTIDYPWKVYTNKEKVIIYEEPSLINPFDTIRGFGIDFLVKSWDQTQNVFLLVRNITGNDGDGQTLLSEEALGWVNMTDFFLSGSQPYRYSSPHHFPIKVILDDKLSENDNFGYTSENSNSIYYLACIDQDNFLLSSKATLDFRNDANFVRAQKEKVNFLLNNEIDKVNLMKIWQNTEFKHDSYLILTSYEFETFKKRVADILKEFDTNGIKQAISKSWENSGKDLMLDLVGLGTKLEGNSQNTQLPQAELKNKLNMLNERLNGKKINLKNGSLNYSLVPFNSDEFRIDNQQLFLTSANEGSGLNGDSISSVQKFEETNKKGVEDIIEEIESLVIIYVDYPVEVMDQQTRESISELLKALPESIVIINTPGEELVSILLAKEIDAVLNLVQRTQFDRPYKGNVLNVKKRLRQYFGVERRISSNNMAFHVYGSFEYYSNLNGDISQLFSDSIAEIHQLVNSKESSVIFYSDSKTKKDLQRQKFCNRLKSNISNFPIEFLVKDL